MSSYPPLTSVRDVEVHGFAQIPGYRWACMALAADGALTEVQYDWRCQLCVEAAEEHLRELGDQTQWWSHRPDDKPQVVTLSWLVTRARTIEAETAHALYPDAL